METVVVRPITRFDRPRLNPALGIAAALVVALPVAVAISTGLTTDGVMVALGAFNLFLGCGGFPPREGGRPTVLAFGLNAAGLAAGTLVAGLGDLTVVGVALGIAALSLARVLPGGRWVAVTAAVLFAVGVGIPGASVPVAGDRFLLALLGGAWAIGASASLHWALMRSRYRHIERPPDRTGTAPIPWGPATIAAAATGVAAAAALTVAGALGLPRDYWTMLTVVVVFQTGVAAAISSSAVRVVGTVAGAILGGLLATALSGAVATTAAIGALAGGTLAVRPASPSVYVVLLTPFIIVLLSLSYPSGWALATDRVVDTLIGSACALAATFALWLASGGARAPRRAPGSAA